MFNSKTSYIIFHIASLKNNILCQAVPFGPGVVRPSPLPASIPTNAPTEQEILEHMMSGGLPGVMPGMNMPRPEIPSLPPALANYLASHPLNTELLARPEAKQLLVGLNSGNITVENILQQLSNPALQVISLGKNRVQCRDSSFVAKTERPPAVSVEVEDDDKSWSSRSWTPTTPSTPLDYAPHVPPSA